MRGAAPQSCLDLGDMKEDDFRAKCTKAMPPTSATSLVYKVPVNNKWKAPGCRPAL